MKNLFKKIFRPETIFYLGVFLLPFENFPFAPSAGWATVSPILFAAYLLLNLKHLWGAIKTFRKVVIFFVVGLILSLITLLLHGGNLYDGFAAAIPLALGAVSLFSFYIFYKKSRSLSTVVNLLVISYSIIIIVGLFEFIALKTENFAAISFLDSLMKRGYIAMGRVQFLFTEPSFIGMHLFGVLFPLCLLTKRKDLIFVLILFSATSVLFGSGMRVILDIFVCLGILAAYYIIKHKKYAILPVILLSGVFIFSALYTNNGRFQNIVNNGIYSDGSFATRYFRIQSTVAGYINTFPSVLFGYGLGNSIAPARAGYDSVIDTYKSSYVDEIYGLRATNYHNDNVSFSLEIRLINEFGLILFIIAIIYLFKLASRSNFEYRYVYLAIILYSYLQFESYAFYAIWLYIVIMHFTRRTSGSLHTLTASTTINPATQDHATTQASNATLPKKHMLIVGVSNIPGGIENAIMNYCRHFDRTKLQFDFLCNSPEIVYPDEVKSFGSRVYNITARSVDHRKFYRELKAFFRVHGSEYDIIWVNLSSLANLSYLSYAEKYGIPCRIIHSHNSKDLVSTPHRLLHYLGRLRISNLATDYWACSEAAGKFFYPRLLRNSSHYRIIHNAIDLDKYLFNESIRKSYRKDLSLTKNKVILNVGRFHFQKNQLFLLDIFAKLHQKDPSLKLILVGDGDDREAIETKIAELKLSEHVQLLGFRNDVESLYCAADLLLFPSLFEGLSVTFIEAELSGLPILMSDGAATDRTLLTAKTEPLPLDAPLKTWVTTAEKLLSADFSRPDYSESAKNHLTAAGYDITSESKIVEKLLLN